MNYRLLSLNMGLPRLPSGHDVELGLHGLPDTRVGELDLSKALYAYPHEHYPHWQTMRAQAGVAKWDDALAPGAMGEDLTLVGLQENTAWVGDVLRFPRCELAISAAGIPEAAFDTNLGFPQASRMMMQSGWCGFHLAVRVPGPIRAGEMFELVPGPRNISIREQFRSFTDALRKRR